MNIYLQSLGYQHTTLKLNSKKTAMLLDGSKTDVNIIQNNIKIKIDNNHIIIAGSAQHLGLILDRYLRLREQISNQIKKAC